MIQIGTHQEFYENQPLFQNICQKLITEKRELKFRYIAGGMVPCVKPRHRLGHDIKTDLKYIECENVNWIHVT